MPSTNEYLFEELTDKAAKSIVFIPLNKLYRSTIIQLTSKDKLILARRYKGRSIEPNQGKITDGKVYKLSHIVTAE